MARRCSPPESRLSREPDGKPYSIPKHRPTVGGNQLRLPKQRSLGRLRLRIPCRVQRGRAQRRVRAPQDFRCHESIGRSTRSPFRCPDERPKEVRAPVRCVSLRYLGRCPRWWAARSCRCGDGTALGGPVRSTTFAARMHHEGGSAEATGVPSQGFEDPWPPTYGTAGEPPTAQQWLLSSSDTGKLPCVLRMRWRAREPSRVPFRRGIRRRPPRGQ